MRLIAELTYVAVSFFIALPAFLYSVWGAKFMHSTIAVALLLASIAWLIGGLALLSKWRRSRGQDIRDLVTSVAPNFHPQVELADYFNTKYVGIDAATGKAVVINKEKNIARCEPITYIQSAEVSDAKGNIHSAFTFHFRDFANPSMEIRVSKRRANDTGARIRYALEHA
jgi:hypothetical protein